MTAIADALNTALTNAVQVTHGTAYFDLHDYVRKQQNPEVASHMAQAIAFSVDVALTGACRTLMKNLRTAHVDHGIDSLSEMTAALAEMDFAEQVMDATGKDDLGPVETIKTLSLIREGWQNLAKELTGLTFDWQGRPRDYAVPDIEDILTREVKLAVKPVTMSRIRTQVERRAGTAPKEDIQKIVDRRIKLEEQRASDRSKAMNEQQGTLLTLYALACDRSTTIIAPAFHEMPVELRRTMLEAALRGAARAEDYATSNSSVTDTEFDAIGFAVLEVERQLKTVLSGAAYTRQ